MTNKHGIGTLPEVAKTGVDGAAILAHVERKSFITKEGQVQVLSNLTVSVYEREVLAILGPSGCGKTTFLRLLAGLDTDYLGQILILDKPVTAPAREHGLMFQEPRLLPWLSAERNVRFALPRATSRERADSLVGAALELVQLSSYSRLWPSQLSGGMARRVALARAIVNQPRVLLLDEPFTGLDSPTKYGLHDAILRIRSARDDLTTVLVTHDVEEAVYLSDRVLLFSLVPARVVAEFRLNLPRPRQRDSGEFHSFCDRIRGELFSQQSAHVGKTP